MLDVSPQILSTSEVCFQERFPNLSFIIPLTTVQADNQSTILFLSRRFREAVEDFSSNGAFLPIVVDAGFESFMVESISGGKGWDSFGAAARAKKIFVRELPPSDVPEENNPKFAAHSAVIKDILEHLEKTPAHLDVESGHEKEELLVQIRSHLNLLRAIVDHAWQLHKTEQRRKCELFGVELSSSLYEGVAF